MDTLRVFEFTSNLNDNFFGFLIQRNEKNVLTGGAPVNKYLLVSFIWYAWK